MYPIATTVSDFQRALDSKAPIAFDTQGNWYIRWQITSIVLAILGMQKQAELDIAKNFSKFLQQIHVPSNTIRSGFRMDSYDMDEVVSVARSIKQRLKYYKAEEKEDSTFAKEYKKNIKESMQSDTSEYLKTQLATAKHLLRKARHKASCTRLINELNAGILSLYYCNAPQDIIEKTTKDLREIKHFKKSLKLWKEHHKDTRKLNADEKNLLSHLCSYSHFIKVLHKDKIMQNDLFSFAFDKMYKVCPQSIDIYIQYPKLQRRITRSFLDKRLKRIPNQKLSLIEHTIVKDEKSTLSKSVRMTFHGHSISILNSKKRVWFGEEESRTVGEIFKGLKNQNFAIPEVDLHYTGFELCLRSSPEFDCTSDRWWEALSALEIVSRDEIREQFPEYTLQDDYAYLVIKANQMENDSEEDRHNVQETHAYLHVYIPNDEQTFKVLSIGLYGEFFLKNDVLTAMYTYRTIKGIIAIPDPCEYKIERTTCSIPLPCSESQFGKLMSVLGKYLQKSKDGSLIYQPQGYNCSTFIQDVLEETFTNIAIPKIFHAPVHDLSVVFPGNLLSSDLMSLPIDFQIKNIIRVAIGVLFGAWMGLEIPENGQAIQKRLAQDENWKNAILSVPAVLFKKKNELANLFHV